MGIMSFDMTCDDIHGEEREVIVEIESAEYEKQTFDNPEWAEVDFYIFDADTSEEVEVSKKTLDKIEERCWKELAEYAEEAKAEMEIAEYESRRDW